MAVIGIIPAAGYAARLQPLNCSKEMLPIAGRPVIDYLAERMRAAEYSELRVVTRPDKQDVVAHAEQMGATVVLGHPATINESIAAGLEGLGPQDVALLGFPDSLWEPADGFRTLLAAVKAGSEVALGLFDVSVPGADYLSFDQSGQIAGFHIKPADPPSSWIWGCAAARVGALDGLTGVEWPSQHMDRVRARGGLTAVRLSDSYVDIGTPEALARASV